MKKETIILWLAAIIIVFLTVYISNIFDEDYPITSTFGIEGKKVSYRFEKVHFGNESYNVIIRSDVNELTGKLFWKSNSESNWQSKELKKSHLILSENIAVLKPGEKIEYYIEIYHKDKKYILPDNRKVTLTFFGKIPVFINVLKHLLLYLGLILVVRTGLEFFNNGEKSKKFGFITLILFLTHIALINPLYLTYKYGFINSSIPPISKLFLLSDIGIFIIWIGTMITIFVTDKFKFLPLFSAILILIIYVLSR
jgi:hypothetical protein